MLANRQTPLSFMQSEQETQNPRYWKPITLDHLLSRYSLASVRLWTVLGIWVLTIAVTLAATILLLPEKWISLSSSRTHVINFFLFNPALILGMLLFFWFGFEWGFIPIFLSSFIIAFHSSMPWGWALVFGFAFVLGLAICAMAYQGFGIRYDLRSFKSIVFYISITFIASIGSSLGAFIWSFTHRLSAFDTLVIWKGWWSGSFLQAILIIAPILWLGTPAIERLKGRWFELPDNKKVSVKWVFGAVASITGALVLFIFSGKLLGKMRVQEVMTEQQAATVMDVVNALESFEIISWISIGIIVVTGYGAFNLISGWNRRLNREVNNRTRQLNESQEKLEASLEEKKALLQEIHHRVKNNLAQVNALLELQEIKSGTDGKQSFKTVRTRIKSMAMAHEALYENKSFSDINMREYVQQIAKITHHSFGGRNASIDLQFALEDITLDMDKSIPLGLLVNEILINAYKHAFTGREEGTIRLESEVNEEQVRLSICDSGVGMPEEGQRRSGSLGMTLIKKFARQLHGDLSIDSSKGEGTSFRLIFEN